MAKGYALITPEMLPHLEFALPLGVTVGEISDHGGAKRVELNGKQIVKDQGYQLVVTGDPHGKYIELVENPALEDREQNG